MSIAQHDLMDEVQKSQHRAAPEALWAQMRREPISMMSDGSWVVSSYAAVRDLIASPSISVDLHKLGPGSPMRPDTLSAQGGVSPPFIRLDPPEHERVRRLFMRHFGPPTEPGRVLGLEPAALRQTTGCLDACASRTRMDVFTDFTYPLPVSLICTLLGVPVEDEPRWHRWSTLLAMDAAPRADETEAEAQEVADAASGAFAYMLALVNRRKSDPGDDLVSGMVHDSTAPSRISDEDIANNAIILLVGGHGTTASGTASAILHLLRDPDALAEVRADPSLVPAAFEETLRLEAPVQFRDRAALADITWGGTTIPKGAYVRIAIAAANRDPERFPDPDRFDIHRTDNQHLSFYGGPHFCFGAPLARMEARTMISEWVRRVQDPRLVEDPPAYDHNPALRSPSRLLVDYARITD